MSIMYLEPVMHSVVVQSWFGVWLELAATFSTTCCDAMSFTLNVS